MSYHSDDTMLMATSDSFWEPRNYKRTTKRIEDGFKLCRDIITLLQERADIEKTYAKNLKWWNKKLNELFENGPEYGSMKAAWKGMLVEADQLSNLHIKVGDNLCNEVVQNVKTWQKDSYHKNMMQIKERKEMEDSFKKAQKPWIKLLAKVNKAKADYYNACKVKRYASNLEGNSSSDSSLSPDQIKKMQDRVGKTKEDVQRGKEKYKLSLQELNNHNPKYMEEMKMVFDKCQMMEAQRLLFFKETLFSIQKCLNISQDPVLPQIYDEFLHTVNNADHEKDLKWWSNNHGVNMAMNWPVFEEYTEEFREIAKVRSKDAIPGGNITLINQRQLEEDTHKFSPPNIKASFQKKVVTPGSCNSSDDEANSRKSHTNLSIVQNGNRAAAEDLFDEGGDDDWDEEGNNIRDDNGEPGIHVRALYDYDGAESDELSFKQGELFEKLEDQDGQGWCKGRKQGRVGLYPANYVEPVV